MSENDEKGYWVIIELALVTFLFMLLIILYHYYM